MKQRIGLIRLLALLPSRPGPSLRLDCLRKLLLQPAQWPSHTDRLWHCTFKDDAVPKESLAGCLHSATGLLPPLQPLLVAALIAGSLHLHLHCLPRGALGFQGASVRLFQFFGVHASFLMQLARDRLCSLSASLYLYHDTWWIPVNGMPCVLRAADTHGCN